MVTTSTPSIELEQRLALLLLDRPDLVTRALARLLAPELAAELTEELTRQPTSSPSKSVRPKRRRRASVRLSEHPCIIPTDIDQAKARHALARMGVSRGK